MACTLIDSTNVLKNILNQTFAVSVPSIAFATGGILTSFKFLEYDLSAPSFLA